jgi:4-hydroxy-tetrahydrodipicolinate reductase
MRVIVHGAGGKVGAALLSQIEDAADLTLGAAIRGRADLPAARLSGDVVVDFSAPEGSLALLDRLAGSDLPLVIGTTGLGPDHLARITSAAAERPILLAANFTLGFEPFQMAGAALAAALPDARLIVGEIYTIAKKPTASGTTQQLVAALTSPARRPETDIGRVGDTPGVNSITLDLGVSQITLTMTVRSRAAYAAGALSAARWLIGQPPGLYSANDMFRENP